MMIKKINISLFFHQITKIKNTSSLKDIKSKVKKIIINQDLKIEC